MLFKCFPDQWPHSMMTGAQKGFKPSNALFLKQLKIHTIPHSIWNDPIFFFFFLLISEMTQLLAVFKLVLSSNANAFLNKIILIQVFYFLWWLMRPAPFILAIMRIDLQCHCIYITVYQFRSWYEVHYCLQHFVT